MPFKEALNTLITQANLSERDKRSELEAREAARKRELKNQDAERTRILRKADALITPILNTVRNQLKRGDIIRTWSSSNTIYEIKLTWDVGVNNSYSFGTFKQIVASVTLDTGSIELSAGSMFKNNGYALSVDNPQLTGEIEKFILVAFEDPSRVEFTWSNYPDSGW